MLTAQRNAEGRKTIMPGISRRSFFKDVADYALCTAGVSYYASLANESFSSRSPREEWKWEAERYYSEGGLSALYKKVSVGTEGVPGSESYSGDRLAKSFLSGVLFQLAHDGQLLNTKVTGPRINC